MDALTLPTPDELTPLLPGVGSAVLLAAIAAALHRRSPQFAALLNGLVMAVAVCGAWYTGSGLPELEDARELTSSERALAVLLVFSLIGGAASPARIYRLAQFALSGGCVWYLLRPLIERAPDEPYAVSAATAFLTAGSVMAFWMLVEDIADRTEGWPSLGVPGLILGLYAQTSLEFGSAKLAALLGVGSMVLMILAPFARWLPGRGLPVAAVAGVVGCTVAFGIDAWFYGADPSPPWKPLVLAAAAPVLLYLRLVRGVRERAAMRFIGPMVLVLALLIFCGWKVMEARPRLVSDTETEDMADWYK